MKATTSSRGKRFGELNRRMAASSALQQAGWVTGVFILLQMLRLAANIVLAHLLAPAIFGVMTLVNSLRAGVELLTDVGIGQNIVVSERGDEPGFYNTAWTVQVLRGIGLTLIGALTAWPIAWLYGRPSLFPILLLCSAIFFLTGVQSPARFLMQRRRHVRNLMLVDALNQVIGVTVAISFALIMPTVWGMTWAMVISGALFALVSYAIMDVRTLSLRIEREHLHTILHFGKWIFASSLVYFAASNFDRLYLPAHMSLALFGIYGIARSMSELATTLMQRVGGAIIFPAVARESATLRGRMPRIAKLRSTGLALVSTALGGAIAISDLFVTAAYDARYAAATVILPMLLAGAWFSVHAAVSESVLLGLAQARRIAGANLLKLIALVTLVTFALMRGNVLVAFACLALGDVPRYFALLSAQNRVGLRFGRQDAALFVLMIFTAAAVRSLLVTIGFADGFISSVQGPEIELLLAGAVG